MLFSSLNQHSRGLASGEAVEWLEQYGHNSLLEAKPNTLLVVMLVFTGKANVYLVREHHTFWKSPPSRWRLPGMLEDVIIIGILAIHGFICDHSAFVLFW